MKRQPVMTRKGKPDKRPMFGMASKLSIAGIVVLFGAAFATSPEKAAPYEPIRHTAEDQRQLAATIAAMNAEDRAEATLVKREPKPLLSEEEYASLQEAESARKSGDWLGELHATKKLTVAQGKKRK